MSPGAAEKPLYLYPWYGHIKQWLYNWSEPNANPIALILHEHQNHLYVCMFVCVWQYVVHVFIAQVH